MDTSFTDYYAVLGVPADADLNAIKSAFRRLAMRYHPDRGGSHEKMLQIIEAFRVLINPTSRAEYDRWRANLNDPQARQAAEEAVHTAAAQAANYPPRSDQMDKWMDSVAKDFLSASYGKTKWAGATMPTVENSTSGVLFLLIGGIVGGIAAAVIGFGIRSLRNALALRAVIIGGACGGAWVAQMLHRGIRASISSTPPAGSPRETQTEQPPAEYDYINCPGCGQQLRFVPNGNAQTVRCPKCRHEFVPGGQPASQTSPEVTTRPAQAQKSDGTGWGVAVAIVAAIFLYHACSTTYSGGLFGDPTTETNWFLVLTGTAACFLLAKSIAKRA